MQSEFQPLEGVHVLEISHYIAGPYAAMILGDLGADVYKVEPPAGENGRRALPWAEDGESLYYASYNRNKQHIALDLRNPESAESLRNLIRASDVLITNYSVGVPEKLGFGWDQIQAINPSCTMVHISGFGSRGRFSNYVAFDQIVQAISGIVDMTGEPDSPPVMNELLVADHTTALQAALGAVAALRKRDQTGVGSFLEVSMLRSLTALFGDWIPQITEQGRDLHRNGNQSRLRFGNLFCTADGYLVLAPITPNMWCELCRIIGHDEWALPEIAVERTNILDEKLRAQVECAIEEWLVERTSEESERLLQAHGIACGGVRSVRQIIDLDRQDNLGLFTDVEMVSGRQARVIGSFFDRSGTGRVGSAVTAVGADTEVVLGALAERFDKDVRAEQGIHGPKFNLPND
jgi:CoA:oxalate CoA-transferase